MLEKGLHRIVTVGKMQFCFMPVKGTVDAVFILRRMKEEYYAKGNKLHKFEEVFDSIP